MFRNALKGKTANLVLVQAAEKRRKKKQLALDKLYSQLEKRIVPDRETNYDLLESNRSVLFLLIPLFSLHLSYLTILMQKLDVSSICRIGSYFDN